MSRDWLDTYVPNKIQALPVNLLQPIGGLAMHESFDVKTSIGNYAVTVGVDLLKHASQKQNIVYLADEILVPRLNVDLARVIAIPALESSKNLDFMSGVIGKMRALGANRDTHVYAIGGGILQDIATFVTSIYMRGIPWTYFPSTLLSMADSCIGGKSSINVAGYKNLVGNIYPPTAVYVDMNFCETLGIKEIIGGLAEAVKICFARGPEAFNEYLVADPHFPLEKAKGVKVVLSALLAKKWFIEVDEFDRSERLLLNYGHTFGHALEASSNFSIAHGVAVAIGMLAANQYAIYSGRLSQAGIAYVKKLDDYLIKLLDPIKGELVKLISLIDLSDVLSKFEGDKKHRQDQYRIVIPSGEGGLTLLPVQKNSSAEELIEKAYLAAYCVGGLQQT